MRHGTEVYTIGSLSEMLHIDGMGAVATGIVAPNPARGQQSGWPRPAVPTRDAWNYDGTYVAQSGDTFSGIARTYLGQYTQYKDIWNAQPAAFKSDPARVAKAKSSGRYPVDILFIGDVLNMPAAAQAEARRLGVLVPAPPTPIVAPAYSPDVPFPPVATGVPDAAPIVTPSGEVVFPETVITEPRRAPKNPAIALSGVLAGGLLFMWKHPQVPQIRAWWRSLHLGRHFR